MKPTLLLSLAVAGLVTAQNPAAGLPSCTRNCLSTMTSTSDVGGCKASDIGCVCKNNSFLNIGCCLLDACNQGDQQKTIDFASTLCKSAGVNLPDKIECTKNAGASSSASGSTAASTGAAAPLVGHAGNMVSGALVAILAAL